ncbi:tRNA lysidine(34) synthetase TilS [Phenylobacterium sp.]|uniref:tRNA lysidine(34) synthetase TilS n=1 Tax=Phenylobacterium sp. TaxID=1871053 RepID=UPI0037C4FC47
MRRLTPELGPGARAEGRLDARLDAGPGAPLAVALSGGGDSLALTLMAAEWARRRARALVVLTVDHGLSPSSPDWTRACAQTAQRIGAEFRALTWEGPHPQTGLPAAARRARHRLLADAARAAGARVILMGHTADDRSEAEIMRTMGGTTPSPREWTPSPVWPEGRGIFLLRPLLGIRRADLREWLAAKGESWIEDPANSDVRFARSRARLALSGEPDREALDPVFRDTGEAAAALSAEVQAAPFGLVLDRGRFRTADRGPAIQVAGAACLAAAGSARPPRSAALGALCERLSGDGAVHATLAGALILADGARILWTRSPGEVRRSGLVDLVLKSGETGVFDGRFEILADRPVRVSLLAGRMSRLDPQARAALAAAPAPCRGALPAVVSEGAVRLAGTPGSGVRLRPLARARLVAACGGVATESEVAALEASRRD